MAKSERLPSIHPGEVLREDFMKPLDISMNRLALDLRVERAVRDESPIQLRP